MSYKQQDAVLDLIKYNPKKFAYKAGCDTLEFDQDFKLPPYFADVANKNLKIARKEVKSTNPFASALSWADPALCAAALTFAFVFICINVLGGEMARFPSTSSSLVSILEKMQAISKYITWPLIFFGLFGMPIKRLQYSVVDENGFFQRANRNISKLGTILCRYKEEELIDLNLIYNMDTLEIKDDYANAIDDEKLKKAFIKFKNEYNANLLYLQTNRTDMVLSRIPKLMESVLRTNEAPEDDTKGFLVQEAKQQLKNMRKVLAERE